MQARAVEPAAVPLQPGEAIERELGEDESHTFRVELTAGTWQVAAEQLGLDVTLHLVGPDGRRLATANQPFLRQGPEWLVVNASAPGGYEIQVTPTDRRTRGRYRLEVSALGRSTAEDRSRLDATSALSAGAERYAAGGAASREQAREEYARARSAWQALGEARPQALAAHLIGLISRQLGDMARARDSYLESLSLWRSTGDRTLEAEALNDLGLTYVDLGEPHRAPALFEQAIELYRGSGDRYGEAIARSNLCYRALALGELRDALPCFEQVLALHRQTGAALEEAQTHLNLGGTHGTLGEPALAIEHFQRALRSMRALGETVEEAKALNNLGWIHDSLGERQRALDFYGAALEIFRQTGDAWWTARLLNNLGWVYWGLGELRRAQTLFEQALPLRRQVQDRRGEAITLMNLGGVYLRQGEPRQTLQVSRKALELARETSDRLRESTVLRLLGQAHATLGQGDVARVRFEEAMALQREVGSRTAEAETLLHRGRLLLDLSDPQGASESLESALALFRDTRSRPGEAQAWYELARAAEAAGQMEKAERRIEKALGLIESLRADVASPDLRAAFLSSRGDAYELQIDLLMSRHRAARDRGFDLRAFQVSEQSRARSLLDLLSAAGTEVLGGVDGELRDRHEQLRRRFTAKANRQQSLLGHGEAAEEAARLEHEIVEALTALEGVEAEIRRRSPRVAELTRPRALTASQAEGLLDSNTLLLEYALGRETSYLWAIEPGWAASFELPGRREIEALARRVYRQWSAFEVGVDAPGSRDARALSRLLLAPVADRLGAKRLVVVSDGALHYIPFAALPSPDDGGRGEGSDPPPLLARHEIVHLPSASALAIQRRARALRTPARGALAVVADPVFESRDPRLETHRAARVAPTPRLETRRERSSRTGAVREFDRLPSSRREADAIVDLLPSGQVFQAFDFAATKTLFLDGSLRDYRMVHVATHGVIDTEQPEMSGLVLSLVDDRGRPRDGFVRLPDLFTLELAAELVVLSGCQTALGQEMRGEGLVGLARAFMYSGATRVVASLWQVQDRVTAELMARFYQAMLVDGQPPARALRQAQLAVSRQRGWRDPYFWAAFVLQGDWR